MKKQNWVLKILNGLHEGAEIPLSAGTYSIGSNEDNDLVLHDAGIPEQLGSFEVEETQVLFKAVGAEEGQVTQVPVQTEMNLSGLSFGVYAADDVWHGKGEDKNTDELEDDIEFKPEESSLIDPLDHYARPKSKALPLAIALAVLSVGALTYRLWPASSEAEAEKMTSAEAIAQKYELSLKRSPGATGMHLAGYLKNKQQLAQLQQDIQKGELKSINIQVKLQDALIERAKVSLNLQKINSVTVKPGSHASELELSGYIETEQQLETLVNNVKKDVPSVAKWVESVDTKQDRMLGLKKILKDHNLDRIKLESAPGRIKVIGSVSKEEAQRWSQVEAEYKSKFNAQPPLSAAQATSLELDVQSVNIGPVPYIVTKDGRKLMVGASLEEGVTIEQIHADRLLLRKNGNLYTRMLM